MADESISLNLPQSGRKNATIWSKISGMQEPITEPFSTPPTGSAKPSKSSKGHGPHKISIIFLPIYLPLLFIAGAISIPWSHVQKLRQRRSERRFTEQMSAAGRLMTWKEFQVAIENGSGTAIGELLSTKGPFRLCWTAEIIPAVSPHKYDRNHHFAWPEPELAPFFEWCHAQFTNPQSGRARLVCIPEEERKRLKEKLSAIQFVSTCSFPALCEKELARN
jgi:hypothetical protein